MERLVSVLGQMAPYVPVVTYVGSVILAVAVLAFLTRFFKGTTNGLLKLSARLLILFGVVFLIYEAAEMFAGLPASTVMVIAPMWLWVAGLILLIIGILFRLVSTLRPAR